MVRGLEEGFFLPLPVLVLFLSALYEIEILEFLESKSEEVVSWLKFCLNINKLRGIALKSN